VVVLPAAEAAAEVEGVGKSRYCSCAETIGTINILPEATRAREPNSVYTGVIEAYSLRYKLA